MQRSWERIELAQAWNQTGKASAGIEGRVDKAWAGENGKECWADEAGPRARISNQKEQESQKRRQSQEEKKVNALFQLIFFTENGQLRN